MRRKKMTMDDIINDKRICPVCKKELKYNIK